MPFSLLDPALARLVNANFFPAVLAFNCLFFRILAPLTVSLLIKQVDGLATILPLRGPEVHLNPDLIPLPWTRLKALLTPSAMAEWSSCSSIGWFGKFGSKFCDTISCVAVAF